MDKKLMCTHCNAETWVFRDLEAGMPHVNCPQGEGTWFEPANTGLQADPPSACPACGTLPQEAEHDPTCPLFTAGS